MTMHFPLERYVESEGYETIQIVNELLISVSRAKNSALNSKDDESGLSCFLSFYDFNE
jgi:hypothetical protein